MSLLKTVFKGTPKILSFFKKDKVKAEAHRHLEALKKLTNIHDLAVGNQEHRTKNFKSPGYQWFVFLFAFLFTMYFLSPILAVLPIPKIEKILAGYTLIFETMGSNLC